MKVFCGIFAFGFGLTRFSCVYNPAIGRHPSSPLVPFLLGVFSFAIIVPFLLLYCYFLELL